MKKLIFIFLIVTVFFVSCTDSSDILYEAKLTMGIEGEIFNSSSNMYEIDNVTTKKAINSEKK